MSVVRLHKKIFFLIIFLIPLNLGKHFVFRWSYVGGLLIDYLIPAVFVTELLILAMLFFWVLDSRSEDFKELLKGKENILRLLLLFLTSVVLSILFASNVQAAIYAFAKLLIYIAFFLYVLANFDPIIDFYPAVKAISFSVFLLGILAILQWSKQGAVFNNYLFFGEQPYSSSTRGIAVENFFGQAKIPAYGTFRHSNAFGGYLSVVLIWILFFALRYKRFFVSFFVGGLALIFTFSQIAWLVFILGIVFFILITLLNRVGLRFSFLATLLFLILSVFIPFFTKNSFIGKVPSFYRRAALETASLQAFKENPFFGVGLNNNTVVIEKYLPPFKEIRFPQPVHNIFILTLVETGLFSLLFFLGFFLLALFNISKKRDFISKLIIISLFQLIILGSFDHYLMTAEQTRLLFWLILGMSL